MSVPEMLEARTMLSAYVVTSSADDGSAGTLRDAIKQVNLGNFDEIDFTFASPTTITLNAALDNVTSAVLINGTKDASGNAMVSLRGAAGVSNGLVIDVAAVTVKDLSVGSFSGAGIVLEKAGGDTLEGNYIGLDYSGAFAVPNGTGVSVTSGENLLKCNVISGNSADGVDVTGDGNTLQGNLIGTDVTGLLAVGNGNEGVLVDSATNTLIGGATADLGNVLSGNNADGITFTNDAGAGNVLEGNFIGTDVTGLAPLGNVAHGVNLGTFNALAVSNLLIAGNTISGNFGNGIFAKGASNNTIQGNYIGTDGTGHAGPYDLVMLEFALENQGDGIRLLGLSTGNLISGNIISGNVASGIAASAAHATRNTIQNNLIGVDISHAPDGNGGAAGITVHSGSVFASGNTIGANLGNGVLLDAGADPSCFLGNFVGTDSSLVTGLGNQADGFIVFGNGNMIGGTSAGDRNTIAYNATAGVFVYSSQGNSIRGNSIFSNGNLGIGLGSETVVLPNNSISTPASNNNQNYPVITSVTGVVGGSLTVTGTMQGQPNTTYALDFFSNTAADASGYGEGETYLGSLLSVTTDASGSATFTATFASVPSGQSYWSATATDPAGNTSEFSMDVASVVTVPQQVATSTGITSSLNPSTYGQSVTFTATVTPAGGSAPLTGTISFLVNNTVMQVVTLDGTSNSATWTTSFAAGDTAVTAVYSGDDDYTGSQNVLSQEVDRAGTIATVVSSLNPADFGQIVTLMATVTGQAGNGEVPTGTVTFMDNGTPIGTVTLDGSGMASLDANQLTIGSHDISVMYNSDDNFAASSGSLTQNVNAAGGTISGHTYFDVTGNGPSADDKVMGGIMVKLFVDKDGNGILDAGDGAAIKTVVSDNSGTYTFGGITPGTYFVQEVTPSGYVRTAPTTTTYYTDVMSSATAVASNDFDNYQTGCCCNSLTGVRFVINGTHVYSDLRGHVHQGDTVQVQFTVLSGHTDLLSLVSYTAPGSSFSADTANQQQVYQAASGVFGPGFHTLTVVVPRCYFQIDFVCGSAIDQFGPAGSNIFYSAEHRLLSADNGGYTPPPSN
jgi:parallel beta-helix repeat protein